MAASTHFQLSDNASGNGYEEHRGHPDSFSVIPAKGDGKEEGGDDDRESAKVFEGQDLRDDLEQALQGDFNFQGTFYHGALAPTAPNPCLNIEGLGTIGLPLGPRDARAIIDVSARAPFGMGSQTLVDSKVRDTWEIEPSKVKFENPAWTRFIQDYVIPTVWQALGVAPANVAPKCELYKLLLYEPGSHFLPHQDTEKANGMFATAIIVLPSLYTGGEVHVSHSSATKVLDFASDSLVSTALLAWYTDVVHEVKPLKSGYRLALSYNLIHTVPGIPKPVLPDMSEAVSQVGHILRNWKNSIYENLELPGGFVAYLLKHQYSEANIGLGKQCLKGADAHLVTNVESIAEELGYNLYLANLEYHLTGFPDQDEAEEVDYQYQKGGSCDENIPGMDRVTKASMTLENIVDLKGSPVIMGYRSLSVSGGNLIPKEPFQNAGPDEKEYEGYMGNYGGSLEHWYRRTVLIIIPKEDVDGMKYCGELTDYRLYRLQKADPNNLTSQDRKTADRILTSLNGTQRITSRKMFDYTLKWKEIEMWKRLIKQCGALSISVFGVERFIEAWKVFGFEIVRQSFEEILADNLGLGTRIGFIQALRSRAPPDVCEQVEAWVETQTMRAVSSFTDPTKEDIPMLIALGKSRGSEFLVQEILPQLTKNTSVFDFAIAFVKALHENRGTIPSKQSPSSNPGRADVAPPSNNVETMIETLLNVAAAQWDSVDVPPYYDYLQRLHSAKTQRIMSIIETCLLTGHMKTCHQFFVSILGMPGTTAKEFEPLYIPLVPHLRTLMTPQTIDLCTSPLSDVLQLLVGSYLRDVLGSSPPTTEAKVRKIGCGECYRCDALDLFILSKKTTMETFRFVQNSQRLHLEARLGTAPDLVSFTTTSPIQAGSLDGIQITKVPGIVEMQKWEDKVAKAKEFLRSIGDDAALERLMGNRFPDVQKALSGAQPFIVTVGDAGLDGHPGVSELPTGL